MKDLSVIHKANVNILLSLPDYLQAGVIGGTVLAIIKKYLFSDFEYLKWLTLFIVLDTLLAMYYHFRNGTFGSSGVNMISAKLITYSSALILVHGLEHFTIDGLEQKTFSWTSTVAYTIFIMREGWSIAEKIELIKPGFLPEFMVKAMKEKSELNG